MLLFLLTTAISFGLLPLARAMIDLQRGWEQVPIVDAAGASPPVSVIVPARNEQRSIGACVGSLLAQDYPSFEVLVLNDRSTDRTGQILQEMAAIDCRLRILEGAALPEGWIGKCWAAQQAAREAGGQWLLFVDADTRHRPNMLSSAVAYAERHGTDLLSLGPFQELGTFWERAILPAIFGVILAAGGSLTEVNDPQRKLAKANGQFLLFRSETYRRIGGHESVKNEIVDDFAMARRIKGTGHRLLLAGGYDLVATRMYRSPREIWDGFSKNAYFEATRKPWGVAQGICLPGLLVCLPPMLLARLLWRAARGTRLGWRERAMLVQSAFQLSVLLGFSREVTRLTRLPLPWALSVPPGLLFLSLILMNSALRVITGRGVTWKGRRYEPGARD